MPSPSEVLPAALAPAVAGVWAVRMASAAPAAEVEVPAPAVPAPAAPPPPGAAEPPPPPPPSQPAPARAPAAAAAAWRTLPIWSADVRTMVVAADDPDLVLAGTTTGQLYISRDGGASWSDAGAPLPFPGWVVSALRWDPNHPGRLWVALWGVWGGGQVAFSDNLGKSWAARSTGLPEEPVYSLALAPGREGRLYAGTLSGVYGSEDDGASWRRLTAAQPDIEKVTSLVVDPTRPETVIAGTWRRAYRSDDGGSTWNGIFEGMVLDTEIFSFTPVPEHPGEIWASSCGWVYQTLDHGDHWVRFKDFDERRTLSFAVMPDGRLLAGTVSGVYLSADGGKSWRRLSDPALSVTAIAFHPARPDRILIGTEGSGVWISTNGGVDFFRASRGMAATRVGGLALAGDDLLVAVNHAGPLSGVYVSPDRGRTFTADFTQLPTVLDLAVYSGRAYAATVSGLFERRGTGWHRLPELGTERVEQLLIEGDAPGAPNAPPSTASSAPPPSAPGAPPGATAGTPASPAPARTGLVARTSQAVFELEKGVFVRRPFKHGLPRSAAFFDGALWVSDAQGVYELSQSANHTIAAPFAGGHLHRLGEQLLLSGTGGAWARQAGEGEWVQLTAEPSRIVPTGDQRFGALLLSGETVRLYDRESHRFHVLAVPVPARDLVAALVMDGKLLLATSGYGVLVHDLD
ncbi:MAG TPA: hypothetical protein VKY89_00965 [Thermoanaerobaculia bacterium]|nr:hypothetical protein [Thermoanaerobaculia bacterium]